MTWARLLSCAGFAMALNAGSALGQTPAQTTASPAAPEQAIPPVSASSPSASADLEARVSEVVRQFKSEPRFKHMSAQQVRDRVEFVASNVIFATIHEVGHMLIAEMGLPVLGREEDAADAFATLHRPQTRRSLFRRDLATVGARLVYERPARQTAKSQNRL